MAKRGPYNIKPTAERFARFTERAPNGCLLWTGSRFAPNGAEQGYWVGQFRYLGKTELAPRVAFHMAHGRWPEPCCLHRCDNGLCVEEAHLFEGTKADNTADMLAKGRQYHRISEQDARDIMANHLLCRVTGKELAARFGTSTCTVSRIIRGTAWKQCFPPQEAG
jgi:hypothetical protein